MPWIWHAMEELPCKPFLMLQFRHPAINLGYSRFQFSESGVQDKLSIHQRFPPTASPWYPLYSKDSIP